MAQDDGEPALSGARILIIDDEPLVRRAVTRTLRGAGATAVSARNGLEGLRLLEQEGSAITAVLLDLLMPELPGLEVLRRLRQKHPLLPVVVFSGDMPDDPSLSLATRILRKPAEGTELLTMLASAITSEPAPSAPGISDT